MITSELLAKLVPGTRKSLRDRFIPAFNEFLPKYEINTERRVAAFLATVIFESDYLRATEEYASGWAYDVSRNPVKARKLGNTKKGDGPKYKGRSLIQTTGKKNYVRLTEAIGQEYGVDFVEEPERLAEVQFAVIAACVYWQDNHLNELADRGKFFAIQGLVNRGSATLRAKDYDDRVLVYQKALDKLPDDFSFSVPGAPSVSVNEPSQNPAEDQPASTHGQEVEPEPPGFFAKWFDRLPGFQEKVDRLSSFWSSLNPFKPSVSPISGASKFAVGSTQSGGWLTLIQGFFTNNWKLIAIGAVLLIVAAVYLGFSKHRALERAKLGC